jgi:ankyrin repeat protein
MSEILSLIPRILAVCVIVGPSILTAVSDEALIDAARGEDPAAVTALLAEGAGVNTRQADGATALAWAAMRSNTDIAELLLNAGADPDLANAFGVAPLSLAIQNGSAAMVRLLVEHGADPNVARENGETALMTAVRMGQVKVMRLLLDHGAAVNARENKFGQTALMWAAGNPDAVRLLVDRGADVRVTTKTWDVKYTIYIPTTFTLGKTGIPWNHEGDYSSKKGGQNALIFAIQNRDLASARVLLDAGLDVNSMAADGTTPLLASLYNWVPLDGTFVPGQGAPARAGSSQKFGADLATARFLLDLGASATGADSAGYTPLHGAALAVAWARRTADKGKRGAYRRSPALLSLGRTDGEASTFSPDEALEVVQRLLDAGADPNQQTLYPTPGPAGDVRINPAPPGSSAFHIAANSGSLALVKMLADRGADPNLLRKDGHTPFSVAVVAVDLPVVEEMVASGADLSARYDPDDKIPDPSESITLSRQSQTIMHIAAARLAPDLIKSLHSRGAPINWKNDQGETPLDLADHQERFREASARQRAEDDPDRLRAVVRPTETTDVIKELLAQRAGNAPFGASAVRE